MENDPTETLQAMRGQLAANQREAASAKAATERLLARSHAALEQGRHLVARFARGDRSGSVPDHFRSTAIKTGTLPELSE
jgi:hypothetical protein